VNAIISDMKNTVLDRCRDRIEAARTKVKSGTEEKHIDEDYGISSVLKRRRGL